MNQSDVSLFATYKCRCTYIEKHINTPESISQRMSYFQLRRPHIPQHQSLLDSAAHGESANYITHLDSI